MIHVTCFGLGLLIAVAFIALAIVDGGAAARVQWWYAALVAGVLLYDHTVARRRD